jgi:hypothetical protein
MVVLIDPGYIPVAGFFGKRKEHSDTIKGTSFLNQLIVY